MLPLRVDRAVLRLAALSMSVAALAAATAGCPAVYPELGTRTRNVPPGQPLDPPPPPELRWIKFVSGRIPPKTRDGRPWQDNGKASSYAKLFANDREILKTSVQSDTLEPTWPGSPHGNYKILPTDRLRVELWSSNTMNDRPISLRELGVASDVRALDGQIHVEFEEGIASGGEVAIAFEPAHAISGLGLWYELRTSDCAITRLLSNGPAERAGLVAGDVVIRIDGKPIEGQTPNDIRSAFNALSMNGLKLTVKHAGDTTTEILLKEGPIYATFEQYGALD
jgi:hypothetical protein